MIFSFYGNTRINIEVCVLSERNVAVLGSLLGPGKHLYLSNI